MTISSQEARELLYDWHGGQTSPEYAAASSGLVISMEQLKESLLHLAMQVEHTPNPDPKEVEELHTVLDYLSEQEDEAPRRVVNGVAYIALPWAKEYLNE